jgi:Predicted enzyme related to lactoylglutathione lyase
MPRVIHFEIHCDDVERASKFYRELLGWKITHFGGPADYWLIDTGPDSEPGINGGLMKRKTGPAAGGAPVNAYICTVSVANVDDALAKAKKLGGSLAMEKFAVPSVGWLGYFKDTEGNIVGAMQNDPNAK